jgi:hypothetical protein
MTDTSNKRTRFADEALANPFSQSFVPKKKVIHMHGKTSLSMYPDTVSSMGDHELSLAFNINKTAVQAKRSCSAPRIKTPDYGRKAQLVKSHRR